jgi:hypothetical protein
MEGAHGIFGRAGVAERAAWRFSLSAVSLRLLHQTLQ